jgi:hypothetical protein
MDGTGPGTCPVNELAVNSVEYYGFATVGLFWNA